MQINTLDYNLPEELIAQQAIEPRDHSKMLVLNRSDNSLADKHFFDLPEFLQEGDVLVLNDTKVIPARINFRKTTGGKIEGLFLREIKFGEWEVMLKGISKVKTGTKLTIAGSNVKFTVISRLSSKTAALKLHPKTDAIELLDRIGKTPLPPYIHRPDEQKEDKERYQTVFGTKPGAVAAPTAGLHFTSELLEKIRLMDVKTASVTLHVGMGTFEPIKSETVENHDMHSEYYSISEEAVSTINEARANGKKIIAVGTTSVRVLETASTEKGISSKSGWTDIFIYPPFRFRSVDVMITNFHLPRTTLLAMIFAFAGRDFTLQSYEHAIRNEYRFYSYGDAMLIL